MRFLIVLLFISVSSAFAADWSDLLEGETYKIKQNISLTQNERSRSRLEIMKGEKTELKEIAPLYIGPVTLFIFDYKNCPGPAITTELDLLQVEGVEIGAELVENCELYIFVSNQDLMTNSLFE